MITGVSYTNDQGVLTTPSARGAACMACQEPLLGYGRYICLHVPAAIQIAPHAALSRSQVRHTVVTATVYLHATMECVTAMMDLLHAGLMESLQVLEEMDERTTPAEQALAATEDTP